MGGPGVQIDNLELRVRGPVAFRERHRPSGWISNWCVAAPVRSIVQLVQSRRERRPRRLGRVAALPALDGDDPWWTYNTTAVPELSGRFDYADRQIATHLDALRRNGKPMMTVDGLIPINLALSGVTGSRLLSAPMSVDLVADSLPLELIPEFTAAVSNLHGKAAGRVTMRGTLKGRHSLATLARGSSRWRRRARRWTTSPRRFAWRTIPCTSIRSRHRRRVR
jgi:hypothetical protein